MKQFRTGSAALVIDSQRLFNFLPSRYQVDIRTASFMLRFMTSDNFICKLFALQAERTLADIYTRYGDSINSIISLKDAIWNHFNSI